MPALLAPTMDMVVWNSLDEICNNRVVTLKCVKRISGPKQRNNKISELQRKVKGLQQKVQRNATKMATGVIGDLSERCWCRPPLQVYWRVNPLAFPEKSSEITLAIKNEAIATPAQRWREKVSDDSAFLQPSGLRKHQEDI